MAKKPPPFRPQMNPRLRALLDISQTIRELKKASFFWDDTIVDKLIRQFDTYIHSAVKGPDITFVDAGRPAPWHSRGGGRA